VAEALGRPANVGPSTDLLRGSEWKDVEEAVRIVRIPCRFGGARPYFICPGLVNGIACGRRVAKLHGPGRCTRENTIKLEQVQIEA
jgi:hypothetical protein